MNAPVQLDESDGGFVSPCAVDVELYLDPLLEDPPAKSSAPKEQWADYARLVAAARRSCSSCPLLADCLYKAIAQTDVSGFVGCTTPAERRAIRKRIGISVQAEDLDTYAGTRGDRQPVEHDDVLRMRAAHPDDSLETLAERLDCSLSTVKRHLRRARHEAAEAAGNEPPELADLPSMDQVLEAFDAVVDVRSSAG